MAALLEEAAGLAPRTPLHDRLTVEHGLPEEIHPDLFSFSGGVADCIYGLADSALDFCDMGEAFGRAVARSQFFEKARVIRPKETRHATVIGAGAYSAAVSGSTIQFRYMDLPIKSLPVASVPFACSADIGQLGEHIRAQYDVFGGECAIYLQGIPSPSWDEITAAAREIAPAMLARSPKVIILREDMAKALGQALSRQWPKDTPFLCLDGIELVYGDTVDIGKPLSDGRVIPVIVKTFAFSQSAGEVK